MAGPRVDQAGGQLAAEGMIQTSLVTADAGVDLVGTILLRLQHQLSIGQERPGHGDHVGIAVRQDFLGDIRHVNPVGGHQGNADLALQARCYLGKCGPGHRGGNGRNTGFVPTDTGVDNGGSGFLDFLGQVNHFFPGAAVFNQVQHGQPVDDNKVLTHPLTDPAHNLQRQTDTVLVAAAPLVGAVVGVSDDKLVDEVTFRTHDLDAVIAGPLRESGAIHVIVDLLLDTGFVQLPGFERVDGRLNSRGCHQLRRVGVAASMQNLHTDLATFVVNRLGDDLVLVGLFLGIHLGRMLEYRTFRIRAYTTSHDKTNAATGALSVESSQALKTVFHFLKAGVHGPHQGTVA